MAKCTTMNISNATLSTKYPRVVPQNCNSTMNTKSSAEEWLKALNHFKSLNVYFSCLCQCLCPCQCHCSYQRPSDSESFERSLEITRRSLQGRCLCNNKGPTKGPFAIELCYLFLNALPVLPCLAHPMSQGWASLTLRVN